MHCVLVCMAIKHCIDPDCSLFCPCHEKHLCDTHFSAWEEVQEGVQQQHTLLRTDDLVGGMHRAVDRIARQQNRDLKVKIFVFTPEIKLVRPLLHVSDVHMFFHWKVVGTNVICKLHANASESVVKPYEVRMTSKYNAKNKWKKQGEDDLKEQYAVKVNRDLLKLVPAIEYECPLTLTNLARFYNPRTLPQPPAPMLTENLSEVPPPPPPLPPRTNATS